MKRERERERRTASRHRLQSSGSPPGDTTSKRGDGKDGSPAQRRITRAPLRRFLPPPPLPPCPSSARPCRPLAHAHPPPARPAVPALRRAAWYSGRYPAPSPLRSVRSAAAAASIHSRCLGLLARVSSIHSSSIGEFRGLFLPCYDSFASQL